MRRWRASESWRDVDGKRHRRVVSDEAQAARLRLRLEHTVGDQPTTDQPHSPHSGSGAGPR